MLVFQSHDTTLKSYFFLHQKDFAIYMQHCYGHHLTHKAPPKVCNR